MCAATAVLFFIDALLALRLYCDITARRMCKVITRMVNVNVAANSLTLVVYISYRVLTDLHKFEFGASTLVVLLVVVGKVLKLFITNSFKKWMSAHDWDSAIAVQPDTPFLPA